MSEPTFREMFPEHLGAEATETELTCFRIACSMLQEREGLTDEAVTDRVWNGGDWMPMVYRIMGPPWVQEQYGGPV